MIPIGRVMINSPRYREFCNSIRLQIRQKYPELEHKLKFATLPACFVLDIVKYRDDDFDWDNRISSVQDVLFSFKKKLKIFECLPLDDSYKSLKIYPGTVSIDKTNLKHQKDDYFTLTLVQEITRFNEIDL